MSSIMSVDVQQWSYNLTNLSDINQTIESNVDINDRVDVASYSAIVCLSFLFFVIGSIGIVGNLLVIYAILSDKRMRRSVTNLLLMNLAVSDFINMVVCIPDIIQFIENHGWRLGLPLCKVLRFTEVFALYASVMTLVSVCIERYIAIIHPITAHILCCRVRILIIIGCIWPLAMACASPNLIFHILSTDHPDFTPFFLQVTLYVRIGRKLFRPEALRSIEPSIGKENYAGTMKARRGVVKMLIAGVTVYFVSFSPHQILLVYNTFSKTKFQENWSFLIFVNIMAYASSACNPLLYSIFCQKFRQKFRSVLFCGTSSDKSPPTINLKSRNRNKSMKTTVSEV
ncbi:neuropeptide receptor 15-like [Centruroides sculpturatus]|uniref:neuropeptide receptor 15-like n=1 Tax=Centruroides sculpturatus TaxID=218467 RepID=UPI000C6D5194|nr:neuropeptide receptor 15-like [Centruroides sculpturatus]